MIALDKVRGWIDAHVMELQTKRYLTEHLDIKTTEKHEFISTLIKVFGALSEHLEKDFPQLGMMIVFDLKTYGDGNLSKEVPKDLSALVDDLDHSSPPTTYITRPDSNSVRDISEEYKFPIEFLELNMSDGVSAVYYREFRNKLGIEKNWEFTRSIYFEYFSSAAR